MRVEATGVTALDQQRLDQKRQLLGVFSAALEAAGRQGYASAEPRTLGDTLTVDEVRESWSTWFDTERIGGRYAETESAPALKQQYGELLARAYSEGGYASPKEFLSGLSIEELRVVQSVQSLAAPIDVDSLSEEGALNLLLPPAAQVDLDHDGITKSGVGNSIRFPDSNTPPEVAAAWEEATAGLSLKERAVFELQALLPLLTKNFVVDESGRYVTHYEPGDPHWTNPFADKDYSYVQASQDRLDYLEAFKDKMPREQYEHGVDFWGRFKDLLKQHDAQ